jgi:hypothetical protein
VTLRPGSWASPFWAGLGLAAEDVEAGTELVRRAVALKPAWLTLLKRLPAELAPTAAAVSQRLGTP